MSKRQGRLFSFIITILLLFISLATVTLDTAQNEQDFDSLALTLVGVMIPNGASSAVAVFTNDKTGKTIVLCRGETVGDIRLVRVLENSVIVTKGARHFQIFFGKAHSSPVPIKEGGGTPAQTELFPLPTHTKVFMRSEVFRIIRTEFPRMAREMAVAPHFVDGKISGFKITRLPTTRYLSAEEISENDIIKEVNGIRLDSFPALLSLPGRLKNEKQLDIRIERTGRPVRLVVKLNDEQ